MMISVIVTTWQCEKWLERCRESIRVAREKAGVPVEVLEICDGGGAAVARNRGMAQAKGDWLVFVDGDDEISPEHLRLVAENGRDADFLQFKQAPFWTDESWQEKDGEWAFPNHWLACAYHRSILPEGGFVNYRMGEDRLFLLQCLLRAKRVKKVAAVVYGYRQHRDSTTWRRVTCERWMDRMAAARAWLAASRGGGAEVERARRFVVQDVVGMAAVELRFLGGRYWDAWQKNLDAAAALGSVLPWGARVQVTVCRLVRWRWVTYLVAELPQRVVMHLRG